MDLRRKNILYTLILVVAIFGVYLYRRQPAPVQMKIEGQTMGTTYHITYFDARGRNFKSAIDSLLLVVNQSINTYNPTSEVSVFNKASRGVKVSLPYLLPPLRKSQEVYQASAGAFDPTVMPLVNIWGFGPGRQQVRDSAQIDSIRTFVGFNHITLAEDSITKDDPRVQLDFGGIGQGYGADIITLFLQAQGITDMLVELGGEGMAIGKNILSGKPWEIGILDPNSTQEHQFFKAYIGLSDRSFTTSGNYFNYRIINGKKYSHTISPATGYPVQQALLSASVFARDCATADAWGTALMVMGHEKAIALLQQHPELDAMLIYTNDRGEQEVYTTAGIKSILRLESPNP